MSKKIMKMFDIFLEKNMLFELYVNQILKCASKLNFI